MLDRLKQLPIGLQRCWKSIRRMRGWWKNMRNSHLMWVFCWTLLRYYCFLVFHVLICYNSKHSRDSIVSHCVLLQLLNWIAQTRQWLENRSNILTLDATRKKLEDYREYRSHLKPPRLDEKGRLETMYNSLQTRLRLSNRPAYLPTEGKLIQVSDLIITIYLLCKSVI